jgi:hypothetical protein
VVDEHHNAVPVRRLDVREAFCDRFMTPCNVTTPFGSMTAKRIHPLLVDGFHGTNILVAGFAQ